MNNNKSKKLKIEVYTSPTCPYCPAALKMLKNAENIYGDALEVSKIDITTKDGQTLASFYNVLATPTIVMNSQVKFRGAPPGESILYEEIEKYLDEETLKIAKEKKKKRKQEISMMYS
ncbi:MAG: thioredoxin [Candidatus Lokiarchaeota archaeon]|nr:thioredoxin [Candidatus Lokiarchaeota archaeon]